MLNIVVSALVILLTSSTAFSQEPPEELEFGPFYFGACLNCETAFFFGKSGKDARTVRAAFDSGDFKGIWAARKVAVLMFETDSGGAVHLHLGPREQATVKIWLTRGTSLNPGDPDFVGIWGTGGTYIPPAEIKDLYTDATTPFIVDAGVVKVMNSDPGSNTSELLFTIDTANALVAKESAM